jgi:hypothetical protein
LQGLGLGLGLELGLGVNLRVCVWGGLQGREGGWVVEVARLVIECGKGHERGAGRQREGGHGHRGVSSLDPHAEVGGEGSGSARAVSGCVSASASALCVRSRRGRVELVQRRLRGGRGGGVGRHHVPLNVRWSLRC